MVFLKRFIFNYMTRFLLRQDVRIKHDTYGDPNIFADNHWRNIHNVWRYINILKVFLVSKESSKVQLS